jgi:hypothetical protein
MQRPQWSLLNGLGVAASESKRAVGAAKLHCAGCDGGYRAVAGMGGRVRCICRDRGPSASSWLLLTVYRCHWRPVMLSCRRATRASTCHPSRTSFSRSVSGARQEFTASRRRSAALHFGLLAADGAGQGRTPPTSDQSRVRPACCVALRHRPRHAARASRRRSSTRGR